MNTPQNIENDETDIGVTLTFHEFRIEPKENDGTKKNVFLSGTMIFDFINKYIKENQYISERNFEILEVNKEHNKLGNDESDSFDVLMTIEGDDHHFVREIDCDYEEDDGPFYDDYIMSKVFDFYVTKSFDKIDITSTVQLTFFSGSG